MVIALPSTAQSALLGDCQRWGEGMIYYHALTLKGGTLKQMEVWAKLRAKNAYLYAARNCDKHGAERIRGEPVGSKVPDNDKLFTQR